MRGLAHPHREMLFNIIKEHPGLHFRELQRITNLATGVLQYHLSYLERKGLVKSVRDGKFLRYFTAFESRFKHELDREMLSLMRRPILNKIISFLKENKKATNKELANFLGLKPPSICFHMKILQEKNLVKKVEEGRKIYYYLNAPEEIVKAQARDERLLDNAIKNFIELWEDFSI